MHDIKMIDQGYEMPIKWRLAALMADREIDYKELAGLTGFNKVTVNRHKNMRTMPNRLEETTLIQYCKALKCQPGDLLVYVPSEAEDAGGASGLSVSLLVDHRSVPCGKNDATVDR
jgi:putative transcriptional regulator